MQFSFQGRITIGEPRLNVDLRDLEIGTFGGQTTLYAGTGSGGGLVSLVLSPGGGLAQVTGTALFPEQSPLATGGFIEQIMVDGQAQLLFGAPGGLESHDLGTAGTLTGGLQGFSLIGGNVSGVGDVIQVSVGGTELLLVADDDRGRLISYTPRSDGSHEARDAVVVGPGTTTLAAANVDGVTVLVSTDMAAGAVVTHLVNQQGRFTVGDTVNAEDGLGLSAPTALSVVEAHGSTWVVLGDAGTGSLTVMELSATGALTPTDYLLDTLHTRFEGVQDIATVSAGGWSFVIAGGSDDGMSLFALTPDGRLVHLDTIAHELDNGQSNGLGNVEAISATVLGGVIQIFVTSAAEGGITQFSVPLSDLGAVVSGNGALTGTAGDDLLVSGAGTVSLTGGAGADVFALGYHDHDVHITDFNAAEDRIDLSAMPLLYDTSRLAVTAQSDGLVITYDDWRLEISSHNGQALSLEDVFDGPFDWATHLPLSWDLPDPPVCDPGDALVGFLSLRFEGQTGDSNLAQNGTAPPAGGGVQRFGIHCLLQRSDGGLWCGCGGGHQPLQYVRHRRGSRGQL